MAGRKTRLELILDRVASGGHEATIDVDGFTDEQVRRVMTTALEKGLSVSRAGRFVLIRPPVRGDKKYYCEKGKHVKGCRVSRPLCKHRRKTCRCDAVPWPHRAGSLAGCRAGGVPEVILKSRSWQQASRARTRAARSRKMWS